jgi:hypothetical protein
MRISDIHINGTFPGMGAVLGQEDKLMASNAIIVSDDGMEIRVIEAIERTVGAIGLTLQRDFEGTATTLVGSDFGSFSLPRWRKPNLNTCLRQSDTYLGIPPLYWEADTAAAREDRRSREQELGGVRNTQ